MTYPYISLKAGLREWLQHEGLFDPSIARKRLDELKQLNGLSGIEIDDLELGLTFNPKALNRAAARFGELVQETGLQLVVSKTPDDAAKIRLDPGVWPEGPLCAPLALYTRIWGRGNATTTHSIQLRAPSDLYNGYLVYFEREAFHRWLAVELEKLPKARRVEGLVDPGSDVRAQVGVAYREELEDLYRKRVAEWPVGVQTPNIDDDWKFLSSLAPTVTKRKAEEIRRKLAPEQWKRRGRRPST